jgi:hypothetical protein
MQDLKPLVICVGEHSGGKDMPVASTDPRDLQHTDILSISFTEGMSGVP